MSEIIRAHGDPAWNNKVLVSEKTLYEPSGDSHVDIWYEINPVKLKGDEKCSVFGKGSCNNIPQILHFTRDHDGVQWFEPICSNHLTDVLRDRFGI